MPATARGLVIATTIASIPTHCIDSMSARSEQQNIVTSMRRLKSRLGEMGMNPMTDVAIVLATITVIAVSILLVLP